MDMVSATHRISKKISIILIISLLINISPFAHGQSLWEKTQAGFTKGATAVGKAFQDILPGNITELAKSASSKITSSLKEKLTQLKDKGPQYILSSLLENLDKFGGQVSRVANCMATGNYAHQESCSAQDRAALIAISVTVLALTAALVGFTITVAATSKEVDAQVLNVSKEVQVNGWGPKEVFQRLKNVTEQLKQNVTNMSTCLVKRQCTATQKKILFGMAGTIAALALIAVGTSIGAYLYNRQKEIERTEAAQAAQGAPQKAEGPVLGEMGAYTETSPSWKTKFMQQVTNIIQPVKGAGATLKSAYDTIQQEIKKGAIKTKQQATALFEKMVLKAKNIDELIRETFDVNMASALEQFDVLKNQFVQFKSSLPLLQNQQMMVLKQQLQAIVSYGKKTADDLKNARDAWKNLNLGRILQAKITSQREFATKKAELALEQEKLSTEKFQFEQERDAFYAAQAETESSETVAKKPGVLTKIKQKLGKKPEDTSAQIRDKLAEFEKRNQQFAEREEKLNEKLTMLNQQIAFDQFVTKSNIDKIYPTFVTMLNGLDLTYLDVLIGSLLVKEIIAIIKSPSSLPKSGKIGLIVTIGFSAAHNNIKGGIQHIIDGLGRFGKYAEEALRVKPLITAPKMNTTEIAIALVETGVQIDFIKEAAKKISDIFNRLGPISQTVDNIEKSVSNLENAIKNFRSNITKKFIDTIEQSPLTNIPKAPIILFAALAQGIRTLKISFVRTLMEGSELLRLAMEVIPDAYSVANDFNKFFGEVTGAPFINPKFMEALRVIQTASLPDINEGMKILINNLKADIPEAIEENVAAG